MSEEQQTEKRVERFVQLVPEDWFDADDAEHVIWLRAYQVVGMRVDDPRQSRAFEQPDRRVVVVLHQGVLVAPPAITLRPAGGNQAHAAISEKREIC
jgi:hypothetical protein